jgi:hypothetical protein
MAGNKRAGARSHQSPDGGASATAGQSADKRATGSAAERATPSSRGGRLRQRQQRSKENEKDRTMFHLCPSGR